MAGAPDRGEPRTVLEYLLWQQDQTYEEVATEFVALAQKMGERATISARHLGRLARGERNGAGTTPVTRRVLQVMFGRSLDELLQPYGRGDLTTVKQGVIVDDAPNDSREMLHMAAQRARKFLLAGQASLSDESMEQLYEDVRRLAIAYPQQPLTSLLGELVTLQDTVFGLLDTRQRPDHARQLHFFAGIVGGLLAKASHDLADPHDALMQARTAYLCADNADHPGLKAWIRGLQSLVSYWDGRHRESIRYAQQGGQLVAQGGSSMAVWLPVSEARAWAALGNAEKARAAIDQAEAAWDRVEGDDLDDLGGICTFTRPRQLYYAADALAWLPDEADAAEEYSSSAVAAYSDPEAPDWAFGDAAGSRADLAIARIALGEVEGASEALAPVLDLAPEQRINGIVRSAQHVHRALCRVDLGTAGSEMQEEIEIFTRTPLKALPQ